MMTERGQCDGRTGPMVELFVGRLGDNNAKVAAAALQGLERVAGAYGSGIEGSVGVLVPALAANLANTSVQIRTLASSVLDIVARHSDPCLLAQHLSSAIDFGNQRARATLLDKMRLIVRSLHEKKPPLLYKFVMQSAVKTLEEHRADVKSSNATLIKEVYSVVGESIFTNAGVRLPDKTVMRLREIIGS